MLDPNKIHIGIAPIGWTNDDMPELGGDIPFERCISEMAIAGYEGTELGSKFPKNPVELKKILDKYNLKCVGGWFSAFFTVDRKEETVEAFKKHVDFLSKAGGSIAVISEQGGSIQGKMDEPIFGKKPILDDAGWRKLAEGLEILGDIAMAKGLKIAYHHHMGTVVQTRAEVDKLMEMTDPEKVFLLVDTGHITYAGDDAVSMLSHYLREGRVAHIHLKDIRKKIVERAEAEGWSFLKGVLEGTFTVPGDGDIDFAPIFKTIEEEGYEGWLLVEAEQDPEKANPLEYAKKGRETIRKLGGI